MAMNIIIADKSSPGGCHADLVDHNTSQIVSLLVVFLDDATANFFEGKSHNGMLLSHCEGARPFRHYSHVLVDLKANLAMNSFDYTLDVPRR